MVDHDLLAAKLAELADRVARVRLHRKPTIGELAADRNAMDLVAFNLMLAVQTCADITSHLISDEGWVPAGSLAVSFERVRDQGVISPAVCDALSRVVGLRNVVAHGYAAARPEMIQAGSTAGLEDLDAFAREVAGWARGRIA
jgi:uncharacterized protein YutE (UPF0331/DUF86 family)